VQTAFAFSKPYEVARPLAMGEKRCRTWSAEEKWLTMNEFSQMMHAQPYACLTHFDEWKPVSDVVFPSKRKDVAVQAVQITAEDPRSNDPKRRRSFTFTFCLEKIHSGSYKNCWLTVGVRVGDYAS